MSTSPEYSSSLTSNKSNQSATYTRKPYHNRSETAVLNKRNINKIQRVRSATAGDTEQAEYKTYTKNGTNYYVKKNRKINRKFSIESIPEHIKRKKSSSPSKQRKHKQNNWMIHNNQNNVNRSSHQSYPSEMVNPPLTQLMDQLRTMIVPLRNEVLKLTQITQELRNEVDTLKIENQRYRTLSRSQSQSPAQSPSRFYQKAVRFTNPHSPNVNYTKYLNSTYNYSDPIIPIIDRNYSLNTANLFSPKNLKTRRRSGATATSTTLDTLSVSIVSGNRAENEKNVDTVDRLITQSVQQMYFNDEHEPLEIYEQKSRPIVVDADLESNVSNTPLSSNNDTINNKKYDIEETYDGREDSKSIISVLSDDVNENDIDFDDEFKMDKNNNNNKSYFIGNGYDQYNSVESTSIKNKQKTKSHHNLTFDVNRTPSIPIPKQNQKRKKRKIKNRLHDGIDGGIKLSKYHYV